MYEFFLIMMHSLFVQKCLRKTRSKKSVSCTTPKKPKWQSIVDSLDSQTYSGLDRENGNPAKMLFKQYQEDPLNNGNSAEVTGVKHTFISDSMASNFQNDSNSNGRLIWNNLQVGFEEKKQVVKCAANIVDSEEDTAPFDSAFGTSFKEYTAFSEEESDTTNGHGSLTPKGTPIKNLPFSPSQVLLYLVTISLCLR